MLSTPLRKNRNIFVSSGSLLQYMSSNLHLLKVLLPAELAHLGTLLLHVLSTSFLGVGLDLALDGRVEGSQDAGSQEGSIDAVVNSDGCDRDA